jgi:hypothetical protein
MRFIQFRGLAMNPVDLFDQDLTKQIKEWRGKGERILIMMDINDHPLHNKFYKAARPQHRSRQIYPQMLGAKRTLHPPLRQISN